jgi:CHAD domain-containing protein
VAKPWPVKIDPGESFGAAARRVLEVRAREFVSYIPAAISGDDIEHLHDLRVANRRLRAVLEVFGDAFERRLHRAILRETKDAGEPLGAARDLDVQIAFLETFLEAAAPQDRVGVAALIDELRRERDAAYAGFAPPLTAFAASGFLERAQELSES